MFSIVLVCGEERGRGEHLPKLALESHIAGSTRHEWLWLVKFSQENSSRLLSVDTAPDRLRSSTGKPAAELVVLCKEHRLRDPEAWILPDRWKWSLLGLH